MDQQNPQPEQFQIEVIPWVIADSNYLKSSSQKLDPAKTVFVGALHGQLTAKGLAQIMDDIFKGVIYAGTLYATNELFQRSTPELLHNFWKISLA